MELSMNQEQTAKVNNLFRYYRDREEERKILDENEKTRNRFYWALALLIIVALGATVLFYFVRNRQLQRLNDISDCLDIVNREKSEVDKMLKMRDEELASSKNQLKDVTQELHRIEESKDRAHAELARVSAELQENEKRLEEKSLMNKNVINLLHQVQFELNAEEYLKDLKDSASGKRKLSPKEWNRFYKAIDSIWPDFNEQMCAEDKEITEDRKRVLYLNLAGFSNAQIQNLTGLSRTTVWRIKKEGVIKE
ncbi:MAG: emp24/gp25L/p24 family protein [Bacteroidales bacterium]|nr:emp24/gp25L/p24 family protein [Bacteroidales bacterium]